MSDTEASASKLWLERRAPGFRHLPDHDRSVIFDFAFLWSLFEARIMKNYARADFIREKVDHWAAEGSLDADTYDVELAYFQNRYYANGQLTQHFPFLKLRQSDHPDLVEAVIKGASSSPRDTMLALLMIIWRLRNNLFHGEKWAYELRGQFDNFTHANNVLMKLLDRHDKAG